MQFAFDNGGDNNNSAYVVNTQVPDHVLRLLGVSSEDLAGVLTNKTSYVKKLCTIFLNAEQSTEQHDQLVRDLYIILFPSSRMRTTRSLLCLSMPITGT